MTFMMMLVTCIVQCTPYNRNNDMNKCLEFTRSSWVFLNYMLREAHGNFKIKTQILLAKENSGNEEICVKF